MEATELDEMMFAADMNTFFDLAFARERAGTMTIEQIGRLFPSDLILMSPWQKEDLEIAESYREADERFFAEEASRVERAEDHWHEVEDRLARRDHRRRKRI